MSTRFSSDMYTKHAQEIHYQRWAVAARTATGAVHVRKPTDDGDVMGSVTKCVLSGYTSKSMSAMLGCWSDIMKTHGITRVRFNSRISVFLTNYKFQFSLK